MPIYFMGCWLQWDPKAYVRAVLYLSTAGSAQRGRCSPQGSGEISGTPALHSASVCPGAVLMKPPSASRSLKKRLRNYIGSLWASLCHWSTIAAGALQLSFKVKYPFGFFPSVTRLKEMCPFALCKSCSSTTPSPSVYSQVHFSRKGSSCGYRLVGVLSVLGAKGPAVEQTPRTQQMICICNTYKASPVTLWNTSDLFTVALTSFWYRKHTMRLLLPRDTLFMITESSLGQSS